MYQKTRSKQKPRDCPKAPLSKGAIPLIGKYIYYISLAKSREKPVQRMHVSIDDGQ